MTCFERDSLCGEPVPAIALIFASDMSPPFHPRVRNECDKSVTSTLLVTPTGYGGVLKYLTNQGKTGRGEKMDSRLRRSVLRTAQRASVGASRLGVNFRPLPPEGSAP